MIRKILLIFILLIIQSGLASTASAKPKKILFFSKSSGYEHSVIKWKNGQPSHVEKVLLELGQKNGWEFVFSKDGSKFNKEYLAQFDAVFFYTSGNLFETGNDKHPAMTPEGKQALFDYVREGKAFIGTHSCCDSIPTNNEPRKGPVRYVNQGDQADPYVKFIGSEFIKHGEQQMATNTVINPKFPGFEKLGPSFSLHEEWYSLKDFNPDIHVLCVIDSTKMKGDEYKRPPYPTTWARKEGKGRVWYSAMGHREDIWTNSIFKDMLVGWHPVGAPRERGGNSSEYQDGGSWGI
jgi:uncharacterized protein